MEENEKNSQEQESVAPAQNNQVQSEEAKKVSGDEVSNNAENVTESKEEVPVQQEGVASDGKGAVPDFMKKSENQPKTTSEEKVWALVSYIPFVAFVALVTNPKSEYIKLHGRQGIVLFAIFFFNIFVYLVPFIGAPIGMIIHFGSIGIGLFSMYQAYIGNWWKIPVLGDVAGMIPVEGFTKVAREAAMGPKVDQAEQVEDKSGEGEKAATQEQVVEETVEEVVPQEEVVAKAAENVEAVQAAEPEKVVEESPVQPEAQQENKIEGTPEEKTDGGNT